ncbi:MAG: class I SAM-dependent methyltransferase [Lacrimispora sp.]
MTPLDASEMCQLAEIHTGLEVLRMTYEEMDFDNVFDGIWACASLLHTPKKELSDILTKIARALNDKGILYMSFKLGDFEGFRGERYFCDFTADSMTELLKDNDRFDIIKLWETEDVRSGHSDIRWLNVLVRKQ